VFIALQHVERFFAADLADDDAIGTHTQGVDDELALLDRALALRCSPDASRGARRALPEHQFRGVLDRDDAFRSEMKLESTLSSVVLPAPVPPEIDTFNGSRSPRAGSRASAG
jgi:hypothetical protein